MSKPYGKFYKDAIHHYLGDKCDSCESIEKLNIHHILPLGLGGTNTLGNFQLLCQKCHMKIHITMKSVMPIRFKAKFVYKKTFICEICKQTAAHKSSVQRYCDNCRYIGKQRYRKIYSLKHPYEPAN